MSCPQARNSAATRSSACWAGAFGAVYEARKLPLGKRTALKVLHREFLRQTEVVQRFLREAQIVAQIEHPHIVGVFDVGVFDEQPYIAMEFLDGESLADRLKREGTLSPEEATDLLLAVMSAVAAVHEKGIVHRDLKPDNIFIARHSTGSTQPKLLDFGIAKVRDSKQALTVTNAVMGTPYYMSPEQAQESKHIDASSDQWSLAVILFECLTGRCPFQGDSLLALLNAITAKPIPRLRDVSPTMPEGLDQAVSQALERTPTDRWPSVRAFGATLLPYASASAQAQWGSFYGRPSLAPRVSQAVAVDPHAMTGLSHGATLEQTTRSSLGLAGRPRRRRVSSSGAWWPWCFAVASVGTWRATRASGTTPRMAALARPVAAVAAAAPTTLVGVDRAVTAAAITAAPTLGEMADAGAAVLPIAPVVVATSSTVPPRTGRHGGHSGGHSGRGGRTQAVRSPRDCPNGICPPD
ncbi:MAG: serine/threonine protein kinase [Deltaproteobacteria bacterium]|nr:serine/threonine protein kinase [Deltaproteobacteria bacterium]